MSLSRKTQNLASFPQPQHEVKSGTEPMRPILVETGRSSESELGRAGAGPSDRSEPKIASVWLVLSVVLVTLTATGTSLEYLPRTWGVGATVIGALFALISLVPAQRVRTLLSSSARLASLSIVLGGSLAAGVAVSTTTLSPALTIATLCAPVLSCALFWPGRWPIIATSLVLVTLGALPSAPRELSLASPYVLSALLCTSLLIGIAYGQSISETVGVAPESDVYTTEATVLELARAFTPRQDKEIEQVIVDETIAAMDARGAVLLLWDSTENAYRAISVSGAETDIEELRQITLPKNWLSRSQGRRTMGVCFFPARALREPMLRSLARKWRTRVLYGLGLTSDGQKRGILLIAPAAGRARDQKEVEFLSRLAPFVGAALEYRTVITDLEAANNLKEEFLATMSHELRTPINVILGYTEMQLDGAFGGLDAEHRSTLHSVQQQAAQLLELVESTLDVSRLEHGLVKVESVDVDIPTMMEELRRQLPAAWRKPGVDLRWKIGDHLPKLRTDPAKMQILLRNLVHNAMKFTHHGMVMVSALRHPSRDCVTFLVQDTGVGIKTEHLNAIFEMFRQTPDSEHVGGGVGLGLYIVKRLAGALGAEIEVSSAPRRGASFRIHVPISPAEPSAIATAEASA